MDEKN
jgi:hypothetical protein